MSLEMVCSTVLKNSATILMASYLGEDNDGKAVEVQNVVHYLELNRDTVFGDAVYAINKSRQERLRMPEQMAGLEDVKKTQAIYKDTDPVPVRCIRAHDPPTIR